MQGEPAHNLAKGPPICEPPRVLLASEIDVQLSVVIPAYNEAGRIARSLERVTEFLRDGGSFEIVVVDDGSTDGTPDVVEAFRSARPEVPVRLLRLGENRGKGAALRAGAAATRGARLLMMDADLATPIEELRGLGGALDGGAEVAVGSRALPSSQITRSQSKLRVLLGRTGNLWIRALAVPGVHDTQCGFKLFEGEAGRRLFAQTREERFGIDVELLCLAHRRGLRIAEVGVVWQHRDGSKVRWRDYLDVLIQVPRISWSVARRPRTP